MTKDNLVALVRRHADEAEEHYLHAGPNKREQEEHYETGVSVVGMNVRLLESWLDQQEPMSGISMAMAAWEILSKADRREIWEASGFHFGMTGYEPHDADFWWKHEAQ